MLLLNCVRRILGLRNPLRVPAPDVDPTPAPARAPAPNPDPTPIAAPAFEVDPDMASSTKPIASSSNALPTDSPVAVPNATSGAASSVEPVAAVATASAEKKVTESSTTCNHGISTQSELVDSDNTSSGVPVASICKEVSAAKSGARPDDPEEANEIDLKGKVRIQTMNSLPVPVSASALKSECRLVLDMISNNIMESDETNGELLPLLIDSSQRAVQGCVDWMTYHASEKKEHAEDVARLREKLKRDIEIQHAQREKWKKEIAEASPVELKGTEMSPDQALDVHIGYIKVHKIDETIFDDRGLESPRMLDRLEKFVVPGEEQGRRLRRGRRVLEARSRILARCRDGGQAKWLSRFENNFWVEYEEDALEISLLADYLDIPELMESFHKYLGRNLAIAELIPYTKASESDDEVYNTLENLCRRSSQNTD